VPFEGAQTAVQKTAHNGLRLPPELPFSLTLTSPIDTQPPRRAISSRLIDKCNPRKTQRIFVPKGAAVTGRIIRIERFYLTVSQFLILGVKLETVEADGVPQPFDARLQSIVKRLRQDLGSFDQMSGPEDPAVDLLRFEDVTADYIIHRGFEIEARTAAADTKQ
jgi:hypothetical protein